MKKVLSLLVFIGFSSLTFFSCSQNIYLEEQEAQCEEFSEIDDSESETNTEMLISSSRNIGGRYGGRTGRHPSNAVCR